ncbi:MAG: DUF2116 family Zn-ribbon domain-containing protein [Actinomycetota bacterium]
MSPRYSPRVRAERRLCSDTKRMGFNPTRKQVARKSDVWFVAMAICVAFVLVAWAFLG